MRKVGLLYDSVSSNTGDIAIGIALQQGLAKRNIRAEIINPFDYDANKLAPLIVGGGQLLRNPGDQFYDAFRAKGQHILNSVGVSGTEEFDYLSRYSYLSARSTSEAAILSEQTKKEVNVLPCTTTILESPHYEISNLKLKAGEKVVGIHLVPDTMLICPDIIQIINAIPHKKVFIPFTHYNYDKSFMESLPLDRRNTIMLDKLEPLQLHSVISQMSYVIVSSLHATIFAYSQNIPFITMYQKKTHDYFKDRRLGSRVFSNQNQLRALVEATEGATRDMQNTVASDKAAVNQALDTFASIVSKAPTVSINESPTQQDLELKRLLLEKTQLELTITKRDILAHNIIYHGLRSSEEKYQELLKTTQALQQEADALRQRGYGRMFDRLVGKIKKELKELRRALDGEESQ